MSSEESKSENVSIQEQNRLNQIQDLILSQNQFENQINLFNINNNSNYSSGESDPQGIFKVPFKMLPQKDKEFRVLWLWSKVVKKCQGICEVQERYRQYQIKIQRFGYGDMKNSNYAGQIYAQDIKITADEQIIQSFNKQKEKTEILFFPNSKFKFNWNILMLACLFYTASWIPYVLCFVDIESQFQLNFDLIVDLIFFVDVIFKFFTVTVNKKGKYQTDKKILFQNYFYGWFGFDFVTSLPYQIAYAIILAVQPNIKDRKLVGLLNVPRFYRLLRIIRLYKIQSSFSSILVRKLQYQLNISNSTKEITKMILSIMFFNHCMACVWFIQAKIQNFPDSSWVMRTSNINNESSKLYLQSFYWALQTLFTVGYGDINAQQNKFEQILACTWMILGVGFYSYTLGNLTQLIQKDDEEQQEIFEKIQVLKGYQERTNISKSLSRKIQRNIRNLQHQKKYNDSKKFLSELPLYLRNQVVFKTHGEVFTKIQFFFQKNMQFNQEIVHELKPCFLEDRDILYQTGDTANEILFILEGRVKLNIEVIEYINDERLLNKIHELNIKKKLIRLNNGTQYEEEDQMIPIILYSEGSYFGDSDILPKLSIDHRNDKGRDSTAICDSKCKIFTMSMNQILKIKMFFNEIFKEMLQISVQRQNNHKILIAKEIKQYIEELEIDMQSQSSNQSFIHSTQNKEKSNILPEEMEKKNQILNKSENSLSIQNLEITDNDINKMNSSRNKEQIDKKNKIEETIQSFETNIQFLSFQHQKVESIVANLNKINQENISAFENINFCNNNIQNDLKECIQTIQSFRIKIIERRTNLKL